MKRKCYLCCGLFYSDLVTQQCLDLWLSALKEIANGLMDAKGLKFLKVLLKKIEQTSSILSRRFAS